MWEAPDKFLTIMKECFSARSWKNYSIFFKFVKCVVNLIENFHYLKGTYNLWLTYWPIVTYSKMDLLTGYAEADGIMARFRSRETEQAATASEQNQRSSFAEEISGLVQFNYFLSFGGTRISTSVNKKGGKPMITNTVTIYSSYSSIYGNTLFYFPSSSFN